MRKYRYKKENEDFIFVDDENGIQKGSRKKRIVLEKKRTKPRTGYFKYEKYECSESCSEKLSYELAKILNFPCAEIDLAKDKEGNIGIISYMFIDINVQEHTDAKDFFNKNEFERKEFCTITNIKNFLDEKGEGLLEDFLRIMVFDALVGETDRHEENWGLTKQNGQYKISPLYDNGCNLLRQFKDENYAQKFYDNTKNFEAYINKSETLIYKANSTQRYKHFELIKDLYDEFTEIMKKHIMQLHVLTDEKVKNIVTRIPNEMITDIHKEYIIKYITKRRDILLNIIK